IEDELKELAERIAELKEILASESKLQQVIVKELRDVQKKYGDARRTQIIDEEAEIRLEDLIAEEEAVITVTHSGYLKRTPLSVKDFDPKVSVLMTTRNGTVKKTSLDGFSNPTQRGIIAMGVPDDDELIAAELVSADETVFIGTHDGMAIRFPHTDIREMGRQAYGVIGIRLDEGDYVVSMIASNNENDKVLAVSEGGFGKRTAVEEYRTQGRGGKGIINVKTTPKNGKVVAIMRVQEDADVLVMTANGKLIRVRSQDIRAVGRAT